MTTTRSTSTRAVLVPLVVFGSIVAGCSCEQHLVVAAFDGELTEFDEAHTLRLFGEVAETNIPSVFGRVQDVVEGRGSGVATFTLQTRGETAVPTTLAIRMPASPSPGDELRVASVMRGGGWGVEDSPQFSAVQIAFERDGVAATTAEGTVRVVSTRPLTLELDLRMTMASADRVVTLEGLAQFQSVSEDRSCV